MLEEPFEFSLFFVGKVIDMGTEIIALLCFRGKHGLHQNGVFQTFPLQLAAVFIGLGNIAVDQVGIGVAATAAEEASPALTAFRLSHHMGVTEFLYQLGLYNAGFQGAQLILLATNELMAGIYVTVSGDGEIFMTGAAASQAFSNTGTII